MWYENNVFYQIYPYGFCGAPEVNDHKPAPRIRKVLEWLPHMEKLGVGAVLFNPVFQSSAHGYDTIDYGLIDDRLGTNEDFAAVCKALHDAGMRVVLDGVFNHVGREFWAFEDVRQNRESSPYKDWFHIDFGGNSNYDDGFWYEGWEGHYELVKLNILNYEVAEYLMQQVKGWVEAYDIDGLRLDVAYCLDHGFLRHLRAFTDTLKEDFFLVGEMLHGDYNTIACTGMLHSVTNYECYKGLYSSLNSMNFYEIAYSLNRQFGPDHWTLYKDLPLFDFVDNHDVTRAASVLDEARHLPLLYGLLFGMPGIPCLYYGSEWGAEGTKQQGTDAHLRPCFEKPEWNELTDTIEKMSAARRGSEALQKGGYLQVYITNHQLIFQRLGGEERVFVALNAAGEEHVAHFDAGCGQALDLLNGESVDFGGGLRMPPYSVMFLKAEK